MTATPYPPRKPSELALWMNRVAERRDREFAYISVEPSKLSVPLIALLDADGMLFARVSPKCWRTIAWDMAPGAPDDPEVGVVEVFGVPVLYREDSSATTAQSEVVTGHESS